MAWTPILLLCVVVLLIRLVQAQERIADAVDGTDDERDEEAAAAQAAFEAQQSRAGEAAARLELRLLRDGRFSECKFFYDGVARGDVDWSVMARHPELAGTLLARGATLTETERAALDARFDALDKAMSDDDFWRLGDQLLAQRRSARLADGFKDDTLEIERDWHRSGRVGPYHRARQGSDVASSSSRWPDNRVVYGRAPHQDDVRRRR